MRRNSTGEGENQSTYCWQWALLGQIAETLYALEELAVNEVAVEGAKELAAIQHHICNVHFFLIHLDDVQSEAHIKLWNWLSKSKEHRHYGKVVFAIPNTCELATKQRIQNNAVKLVILNNERTLQKEI